MSKRFDVVGSLLRPAELLTFKREIEQRDDITYPFYDDLPGYEAVEKEAIEATVKKQIEYGLDVVSDGEFGRSIWHLDFLWGLQGTKRYIAPQGQIFRDKDGNKLFETRRDVGIDVVGKLSGKNHHFINIFHKIKASAGDHPVKICIPSPAHVYFDFVWSPTFNGTPFYDCLATLKTDLLAAYKEFVTEYRDAGGTILQLDDCKWAVFVEGNEGSPLKDHTNEERLAHAQDFIDYNNELVDFIKSKGLKAWTHNCRGNYRSKGHRAKGSYEEVAELFFGQQNYERFFLEWDGEHAGSLEALRGFKGRDVEVVLGLLSSKTSTLDDEAKILEALEKAATLLPKENLYLSHQCGFASTDHGNELTEDQQWAKIKQGQDIAKKFWGE